MKRTITATFHIVFWAVTIWLFSALFGIESIEILETESEYRELVTRDPLFIYSLLVTSICSAIFVYAHIFFLFRSYFKNQKFGLYFLLTTLIAGLLILIIFYFNSQFIYLLKKPIWKLSYPAKGVNILIFTFYFAASLIYVFILEWVNNEKLKKELIEENLKSELNFLKAQINPHFLFNTLNNLYSVASRQDNEELTTGISELSDLMRYMLYESDTSFVPLKAELKFLDSFINIQQLRFEENELLVNIDVRGDTENVEIAPMVLISFVENAFKHGVKIGEKNVISISLIANKNVINFRIKNKIVNNASAISEVSGIGLENVKRRLNLIYRDKHQLKIDKNMDTFNVNLEIES